MAKLLSKCRHGKRERSDSLYVRRFSLSKIEHYNFLKYHFISLSVSQISRGIYGIERVDVCVYQVSWLWKILKSIHDAKSWAVCGINKLLASRNTHWKRLLLFETFVTSRVSNVVDRSWASRASTLSVALTSLWSGSTGFFALEATFANIFVNVAQNQAY